MSTEKPEWPTLESMKAELDIDRKKEVAETHEEKAARKEKIDLAVKVKTEAEQSFGSPDPLPANRFQNFLRIFSDNHDNPNRYKLFKIMSGGLSPDLIEKIDSSDLLDTPDGEIEEFLRNW